MTDKLKAAIRINQQLETQFATLRKLITSHIVSMRHSPTENRDTHAHEGRARGNKRIDPDFCVRHGGVGSDLPNAWCFSFGRNSITERHQQGRRLPPVPLSRS